MTDAIQPLIDDIVRRVLAELGQQRPANDVYMSVREAADLARVSVYTIRRWVHGGELTEHRAGKHIRVVRSEVLARLEVVSVVRVRKPTVDERVKRRLG